jgi:glutaredoxin
MNKAQKAVVIFLIASFLVILSLYFVYINKKPKYSNDEIIFFYGVTCPHCKNVEDFIDQNNLDTKLKITKKEVYYDEANRKELMDFAKKCNLKEDEIGVPFIYYDGKCYIGERDGINLLKSLAGV